MDNIITNVDGVKVKVRVYDFGDEVADRYTIVYVNKNIILKHNTIIWTVLCFGFLQYKKMIENDEYCLTFYSTFDSIC